MENSPLLATADELELARQDLNGALNVTRRLPDSPFKTPGRFSLCEYESFTSLTFGRAIAALAAQYRDEWISGVVIAPDPETYFEGDHVYSAFRLGRGDLSARWAAVVSFEPAGNAAASIQVQAMILAVAGSSGLWGIWGERAEGVAVVRTDSADDSWQGEEGPFVDAKEALRSFVEPNYVAAPLPGAFEKQFLLNFGGQSAQSS